MVRVAGPHHEDAEAKAMDRAGDSTAGRAGPAGRWSIEDRRRIEPPCRISQANGASDRTIVEEVAALAGRCAAHSTRRTDGVLQSEASADVPHEPERGLSIATVEERAINLGKEPHSE